ncbi:MAG TPA: hypothetical protein VJJ83_00640 [Candidatus Babeliales bacterium]|nr:hypothetical protein [Candidatus Babeliales bacterium]
MLTKSAFNLLISVSLAGLMTSIELAAAHLDRSIRASRPPAQATAQRDRSRTPERRLVAKPATLTTTLQQYFAAEIRRIEADIVPTGRIRQLEALRLDVTAASSEPNIVLLRRIDVAIAKVQRPL